MNHSNDDIDKIVICNIDTPDDHCKNHCLHGINHLPDECKSTEFCEIAGKRVYCRKLKLKEKKILKENL